MSFNLNASANLDVLGAAFRWHRAGYQSEIEKIAMHFECLLKKRLIPARWKCSDLGARP